MSLACKVVYALSLWQASRAARRTPSQLLAPATFSRVLHNTSVETYVRNSCRSNRLRTRDNGDCIFLHGRKCTIHDVKPTQCATYPFWPRALSSSIDWLAEAKTCEGIDTTFSRQVASSALAAAKSPTSQREQWQSDARPAAGTSTTASHVSSQAPVAQAQLELNRFHLPHAGLNDAEPHASAEQVCCF